MNPSEPHDAAQTPPPGAVTQTSIQPAAGPDGTLVQSEDATRQARERSTRTGIRYLPGYDIQQTLGRGGMGVVYLARQLALNRTVALKMILGGDHAEPDELVRFLAEGEALAALHHPNVVDVYEAGHHDGLPYLALEYVPGGSLEAKARPAPLDPKEAAQLVRDLARGAQAAHDQGFVHRDLKPDNVLLAADGTPKITDFGLAKRFRDDRGLTRSGQMVGTPYYMSPEQARGDREIGPATDVWALGAILYRLVAGRPPFQAPTSVLTVEQVLKAEPVPPSRLNPAVPRDLETVCLKCLSKDPARRYPTAGDLAADLDRFLTHRPVLARPVGSVERAWRWGKRNPRVAGLLATLATVIVLALTGITGLWLTALDRQKQADDARAQAEDSRAQAERNRAEAQKNADDASAAAALAHREKEHAEAEEKRARTALDFLGGMFEAADPLQISGAAALVPRSRGEALPAAKLLDRAAGELARRTDLDPETRAFLQERLGSSFLAVGDRRRAVPLLEAAVRVLEARPDANAAALANAHQSLGWIGFIAGDYEASRAAFERALAANRRMPTGKATDLKRTAIQLQYAVVLSQTDERQKAKELAREALDGRAAINGPDDPSMAEVYFGLAIVLMEAHEILPAATEFLKGERIVKKYLPNDPLANGMDLFQKGVVQWLFWNNPEGAVRSLEEARKLVDQGPTRRSVYSLFVIGQLGIVQGAAGRRAEAAATLKEAFEIAKDLEVLTHPKSVFFVRPLGQLLSRGPTKDEAAARATIGEWLDAHRRHASDSPGYADALTIASETYGSLGDVAAERAALADARAIYDRHPEAARRQINWINLRWLGRRHAIDGRWADAEAAYRQAALAAYQIDLRRLDADDRALNAVAWADAAIRQARYPTEVRKELEARLAFGKGDLAGVRIRLARFRAHAGEPGPAADLLRAAVRGSKDPTDLFEAARDLARLAGTADAATRTALVDDAAAALDRAARNGFRNLQAAQAPDAFGPFADHPKVKEATARMQAKAK